jgi:hypothetical protein
MSSVDRRHVEDIAGVLIDHAWISDRTRLGHGEFEDPPALDAGRLARRG